MTANQIAFQNLVEQQRANLAREADVDFQNQEAYRANLARETETHRANIVREYLQQLVQHETRRSNLARESETYRSNLAREQEIHRSNVAQESQAAANLSELQRSNQARELETNRSNIARETEMERANKAKELIGRQANLIKQYGVLAPYELDSRGFGTLKDEMKDLLDPSTGSDSTGFFSNRSDRKLKLDDWFSIDSIPII